LIIHVHGSLVLSSGVEYAISRATVQREVIASATKAIEELRNGNAADIRWFHCRFDHNGRKIDDEQWNEIPAKY